MFYLVRNGSEIDYKSYEPLKEAIEKKLMASVKDLSRIVTKSRVRNKEQTEKYNAMVEEMKSKGYCMHCCDVILNMQQITYGRIESSLWVFSEIIVIML